MEVANMYFSYPSYWGFHEFLDREISYTRGSYVYEIFSFNVPEFKVDVCMIKTDVPCGQKMCDKQVQYPCGTKYCEKQVQYPCGVKYCTNTVKYPCGTSTKMCEKTVLGVKTKYACGVNTKYCEKQEQIPCGSKTCTKIEKLPCGVNMCTKTEQYPCGVKMCTQEIVAPVPCPFIKTTNHKIALEANYPGNLSGDIENELRKCLKGALADGMEVLMTAAITGAAAGISGPSAVIASMSAVSAAILPAVDKVKDSFIKCAKEVASLKDIYSQVKIEIKDIKTSGDWTKLDKLPEGIKL